VGRPATLRIAKVYQGFAHPDGPQASRCFPPRRLDGEVRGPCAWRDRARRRPARTVVRARRQSLRVTRGKTSSLRRSCSGRSDRGRVVRASGAMDGLPASGGLPPADRIRQPWRFQELLSSGFLRLAGASAGSAASARRRPHCRNGAPPPRAPGQTASPRSSRLTLLRVAGSLNFCWVVDPRSAKRGAFFTSQPVMRTLLFLVEIVQGGRISGKWAKRIYRLLLTIAVFLGVFWLMTVGLPHTSGRDKLGVAILFGFLGVMWAIIAGQFDDL
jgi:hypothetical protein